MDLAPLPSWLLLAVLVLLLAAGRWLAWRAWLLIARWTPRLVAPATRLPGPITASPVGQRWPGPTAWLLERFDAHRYSGLPLTLTVVLAIYLASLAADILEEVVENEEMVQLDLRINAALALLRDEQFVQFFHWITGMGNTNALAIAALVALGLLWSHRRAAACWGLGLAVSLSLSVTWVGKYAIGRDRPEALTFAEAMTPSFPSGHAAGAMVVFGFIAYAIARELPGQGRRFEVGYWAAVLILLVGFSRMVLSLHYFSDVAGGWLVGGFGVLAGVVVTEMLAERRQVAA